MERYFAKRTEGDFSETQRIKAVAGHSTLAKQAFVKCMREIGVTKTWTFFPALKALLRELGKAGYTEKPEGWPVTGGRFLPFEKMTHHQLWGRWASVQQTVAKWIYNILPGNLDLYEPLQQQELVFKANDVEAVMRFLVRLLHVHDHLFSIDATDGMLRLEEKAFKCLLESGKA